VPNPNRAALSPFNDRPAGAGVPARVRVADCTLRDGEQQAGLVLTADEKIDIARALDRLGVYEIEAGTPAVSPDDRKAVETIAGLGTAAKVSALGRATLDDVRLVKATGAWGIRISLPAGTLQRRHKLTWTDEEFVRRAVAVTEAAKALDLFVIFSPYDTTRCDLGFLDTLLTPLVHRRLIDRLRLVDTAGSATPEGIQTVVRAVRGIAEDVPFEIHCHDDFGLAVANTIAAVRAGVEFVSTTMNGVGERSGNAATEEVALALELLYGMPTGIALERLTETSRLVERLTRVALQPHKPVVGANSFRHESGMVVDGILSMPFTGEAYDPTIVGQARTIVVGKKSGAASIAHAAAALGQTLDRRAQERLLRAVKRLSLERHRALTDAEFADLLARDRTEAPSGG
jgi:isopropylmalate/homocitrate/citramalate synthase